MYGSARILSVPTGSVGEVGNVDVAQKAPHIVVVVILVFVEIELSRLDADISV
jgi:hypothetical protein